ncbi:hypothetical protein ACTJI2_01085 [Pseudoxanthomonas sp. 22568]|uniref:hypothetical protein n=1 Tax=Pseudoxanthomonas sp. 22568 TaxID=3453945 RepID=UPI003F8515B5
MASNKAVMALVVVALILGAGYWFSAREDGERAGQANASLDQGFVQGTPTPSEAVPRMVSASIPAEPPDVFRRYQCPPETGNCERNPNVAATPKEAQWLLAHGYPTVKQIQDLRMRSTADYREEYQRTGSKVVQSLYAMSLALDGEARTAIGLLWQGAAQGNVYAFHLLSDLYRRTEELANLITSAAYLRAAYLAGDSRAADRYAYQFGMLSPPENLLADKEAFRLFTTYGRGRNYPRP